MFGIGMPELIMILVVALIVIGPKKLPELARSLGKALNEFKSATQDFKDSIDTEVKDIKNLDKKEIGELGKRYKQNQEKNEAANDSERPVKPEETGSDTEIKTGVPEYDSDEKDVKNHE
jgi:Tat protein translocase TatB subunit